MDRAVLPRLRPGVAFFLPEEAEAVVEGERPPRYADVVKPLPMLTAQARADIRNAPRRLLMLTHITILIRFDSTQFNDERSIFLLAFRTEVAQNLRFQINSIEERRLADTRASWRLCK